MKREKSRCDTEQWDGSSADGDGGRGRVATLHRAHIMHVNNLLCTLQTGVSARRSGAAVAAAAAVPETHVFIEIQRVVSGCRSRWGDESNTRIHARWHADVLTPELLRVFSRAPALCTNIVFDFVRLCTICRRVVLDTRILSLFSRR